MSKRLSNLGLSDTKHQIRLHSPSKASSNSRKYQELKSYANVETSIFSLQSSGKTKIIEKPLVLDGLIQIISRKTKEFCSMTKHDRNPTKFICLEEQCSQKIGCSYCFLESHKNHSKIQSNSCLKDLIEIKDKSQIYRGILHSELFIRREEIFRTIQKEIQTIKEDFINNLDYLSKKVREAIQLPFKESITQYLMHKKQNHQISLSELSKTNETFEQIPKITTFQQDIISKFKESSTKLEGYYSKGSTRGEGIRKNDRILEKLGLTGQQQLDLLSTLTRLNLTQVEEYLRYESVQVKQFTDSFSIFQQFFIELNSSLSEFFATFKRAVPRVKKVEVGLVQPEILQPIRGSGSPP